MYTEPLQRLLYELAKMPGIGEKTAERLAFYILNIPKDEALQLADAIKDVKESIRNCSICYNISENNPCEICSSESRDRNIVCVVEQSKDLWAVEKSGTYRGLYHILQGRISPLDGIGPGDLTVSNFIDRVKKNTFKEIILATNPNTEGDATAYYIQKQIQHMPIKITRIAKGVPAGSSLEYANKTVLSDAISGRREL
ncbi:MAG: recombination protein RecR [Planctomycetes bacterium RBG_16_43_13]|nr:MAG: recombination protein RecR [Planctomycetes bacterium RBG_16_43_13]